MYSSLDYLRRGFIFLNNMLLPGRKKLSSLMFYATDLCDSGCKHCLIWAKRPVKHLPKEKLIEVMRSKCITKRTKIGLEGGEFLLHPEATEILKWFSTNHPNFDILSNCLKPDSLIEAVKKYPPKRLFISLDGTKETYLYMRGKDGYDSVISVIESCKDIVPISLMFTLSPYNSFMDLNHVVEISKKYNIDIRVGVYNDIAFFDTVEKAHETEIGEYQTKSILTYKTVRETLVMNIEEKHRILDELQTQEINESKHDVQKIKQDSSFKNNIPANLIETSENYDFLLLYDEWRKKKLKLKCHSITDSLVIHPDGTVPICQNLNTKLGNIHTSSLDEIFNSVSTQRLHKKYTNNCNQCWINFHRKYDIVMLRTLERFLPKKAIEFFYALSMDG
jgi:MoaA/NifB/PqqE/SkfB family radical SAM enzyme